MKALAYVALLCILASLVWRYPFLFEIAPLGAIGGAYWLFFRDQAPKAD